MFDPPDYTVVDQEGLARTMFFPRPDWRPPPSGATDHMVQVEDEVGVACRLYACAPTAPSLLFFHGNGEVVSDYDAVAPLYIAAGINLFVADYRDYGLSGGHPTFSSMIADAHAVARAFHGHLDQGGYRERRFVMGRSLGAHAAVELAAHYPDHFQGLIIESGTASITRMVNDLAAAGKADLAEELERRHIAKLQAIRVPSLLIHGTWDTLVAIDRAYALYETLTTPEKRLVPIAGAGHNDILWTRMAEYFAAIRDLVQP
ncbi:MAG: alpha/beta hydrolase [Chloroflexi bacterium]|nr:alpha/beta hydrolase [Chloroflexota bacterium]